MKTVNADQFIELPTQKGPILINRNHIEAVSEAGDGGSRIHIHGAKYHYKTGLTVDRVQGLLQ